MEGAFEMRKQILKMQEGESFPFCWVIPELCLLGIRSAYALPEKPSAPAIRIKLTGFKFFNIIDGF